MWKAVEPLTREEHDAFWSRVGEQDPETGCIPWIGHVTKAGYGAYPHRGTQIRAHRLAYVEAHGPIPPGLTIDHLCRMRHCVNPDHLEAVDNWTNVRRGESPVALNARKTHCKRGHEFTPENTIVPKGRPTQRHCRKCKNLLKNYRRKEEA